MCWFTSLWCNYLLIMMGMATSTIDKMTMVPRSLHENNVSRKPEYGPFLSHNRGLFYFPECWGLENHSDYFVVSYVLDSLVVLKVFFPQIWSPSRHSDKFCDIRYWDSYVEEIFASEAFCRILRSSHKSLGCSNARIGSFLARNIRSEWSDLI